MTSCYQKTRSKRFTPHPQPIFNLTDLLSTIAIHCSNGEEKLGLEKALPEGPKWGAAVGDMSMQAHHVIHHMPFVGFLNPRIRVASLVEGSHAIQIGVVHEKNWIKCSKLQCIRSFS